MKKWLLAVLPATALAAPPQGFYQNYQDWDIACDNTGTCRLAGYQADETETPVSILFIRKAGANAAVAGEVSLLPFHDDEAQLASIATRNELVLNGKSLGKLALNKKGTGKLSSAQTNALLEALKKESKISIRSGKYEWHLSDKGAAAAMLKADEFQGRLKYAFRADTQRKQQSGSPQPAAQTRYPCRCRAENSRRYTGTRHTAPQRRHEAAAQQQPRFRRRR